MDAVAATFQLVKSRKNKKSIAVHESWCSTSVIKNLKNQNILLKSRRYAVELNLYAKGFP